MDSYPGLSSQSGSLDNMIAIEGMSLFTRSLKKKKKKKNDDILLTEYHYIRIILY